MRLTRQIRRCITLACPPFQKPYRPEEEGRLALPTHEFGLAVITWVGALRDAQHRRLPEIHQAWERRRVALAPRTVLHLLERYDELVALCLTDTARLQRITAIQGRVILALDGLQPAVGHEVRWVLRECLSSEVLLARRLRSATQDDLAALLRAVKPALGVPIAGVISDGQLAIRRAKELQEHVRGVRPLERQLEGRADPEAEVIRGDGSAVRGSPPLGRLWPQAP